MSSNWSYVIASYVITWGAIAAYVVYLRGRARTAAAELAHDAEETR